MKIVYTVLLVFCCCLFDGVYAQSVPSFSVSKSGLGRQQVILIPGYSCAANVWKETVDAISGYNTCYTVTFAGYAGQTPQESPRLKTWVADLAKYIKDNHIDHPIVIGHSLGGGIAMWLAADYPELISKIVVVDALPCLGAMYNPSFRAEESPDCSKTIARFSGMDSLSFYSGQKAGMRNMLADTSRMEMVVGWAVNSDRKTLADTYCQFMNTDQRTRIAGIKCPVLVLLEPSFKEYPGAIDAQFSLLRNKDIRYATKGLHFIMYDDREWFIDNLKLFLN